MKTPKQGAILGLGDIVSPKLDYFKHRLGNHFPDICISVGKVGNEGNEYAMIQSADGNNHLFKITELDILKKSDEL